VKTKKVPLRKCIACNENKSKKELIRVVRNADKEIIVDETGKVNGRGAYVCKSENCIDQIIKTRKLSRTFQIEVPDEVYTKLKNVIEIKSKE
jgi:predicted RNA-binding protein YlxR (DUF448 family)